MAVDTAQALSLMKARLNRLESDTSLDNYLSARIDGAVETLNRMMPEPLNDSAADLILLVDYTVFHYQSRDQSGAEPEWLRMRLRERYLHREEELL